MQRIDLMPHYFHRFVSSHEQLYLSLVPGRLPRRLNVTKVCLNLQAHVITIVCNTEGQLFKNQKMPLLMDLLLS